MPATNININSKGIIYISMISNNPFKPIFSHIKYYVTIHTHTQQINDMIFGIEKLGLNIYFDSDLVWRMQLMIFKG